jgi:bifunctional DNA-binding transcriptional regulator/antitoxin component of YhaV-PrlF toxin-antitoxin module
VKLVRHQITVAGQVSIPAEVRRRWNNTDSVFIEDYGDHLVVRPSPKDPVAAARGAFKGKGRNLSSEEAMRLYREEEARIEKRKYGHLFRA